MGNCFESDICNGKARFYRRAVWPTCLLLCQFYTSEEQMSKLKCPCVSQIRLSSSSVSMRCGKLEMRAQTFLNSWQVKQNTPRVQGWDCARLLASCLKPWIQSTVLLLLVIIIVGGGGVIIINNNWF